jgi:hypothetical protein
MSTPSLLNIPYVIKDGTLYSQIPETGAGDFVVTRATTPTANRSTRVNANGFIELVNDNVPRLDYPLGGAVNGCPALLVEPAATNLALQSEAIGTSPWGTSNATVTANAISSPDNNLTADQINYTANTSSRVFQTIASSNSATYTYSVFIKNNTFLTGELVLLRFENNLAAPNDFEIRAVIDPTNIGAATFSLIGTAGTGTSGTVSGSVQDYGNGWWRVRVTGTSGTAAANATANIRIQQSSSVIARSLYAWGVQLEVGSVATSYIPTTTVAIARASDVIRKTSITSLLGQSEGTVYFEVEVTDEARDKWFCTLDSSITSFIQMWVNPTRQISARINNSGTIVVSTLTSSVLTLGYHKVAFAYNTATNGCIMYVDGVQNPATTRTVGSPGLPAFNNMTFGGYIAGITESIKAHVRAGAVYPNRLSNSELATLTTP